MTTENRFFTVLLTSIEFEIVEESENRPNNKNLEVFEKALCMCAVQLILVVKPVMFWMWHSNEDDLSTVLIHLVLVAASIDLRE